MKKQIKFRIEKQDSGGIINVQILRSVDGGKNFFYCGCGKFCKSLDEAAKFMAAVKYNEEKGA